MAEMALRRLRKPMIAFFGLVIVCALAFFSPLFYRYQSTYVGPRQTALRIHMLTGRTEVFYNPSGWRHVAGTGWSSLSFPSFLKWEPSPKLLPNEELKKLNGNAGVRSYTDRFEGKLYNGSSWVVREVVIRIRAKDLFGVISNREYRVNDLWVPPLETRSFSIDIAGGRDARDLEWNIVSAKGRKS